MKKWKLLVLSALCISCFSAAACKKEEEQPTNALVGFVDETVEIELGDIISLHDFLEVYDEENNLYRATFELTDSAGNKVTLLANEFTAQDTVGYTLLLSAHDPKTGEVVATRTVQLKTVDKSAPIITIGDMVEYGVIGQEICVPLMFDDASQVYSTNVLAMRIPYSVAKNGYDEEAAQEISVVHVSKSDEACFTPTLQGRYKIVVEAWDGTEKEAAKETNVYRSKEVYLDVKTSEGEIEGFDLPSSTVAAYGVNENVKGDKTVAGNSVQWHETFEGKDGVISMKPAKTDSYGGAYYVRSTTKTTDFYKFGTDITQNTMWDYVSAWIYVAGEDGETVEVSGEHNRFPQTIPCNTWYEYRVGMEYFVVRGWNRPWDTFSNRANVNWDSRSFLYVGEGTEADYTVYMDCFSYETAYITATAAWNGSKVAISVEKDESVANEQLVYTYKVVDSNGNAVAVNTDGTFLPTGLGDTYDITVTTTVNNREYTTSFTYEYSIANVMGANEIEGFYSSDSVAAAYGLNAQNKADKTVAGNSVAWYETFEGKNGVISMKPAKTDSYGGAYYVRSTVRDKTFYNFGSTISDNTLWDYVSMWIYIAGEENETVEVSGEYDLYKQTVPCNTWYEYRVGMEYFVYRTWNRPWDTFSNEANMSWSNRTVLYVGADETADYTVYIDKISYENGDSIFSATATAQGDTVQINVTPNVGYETALENATYNYYVRGYGEETASIAVTNGTFTPTADYTTYCICVSVEYNGVKYFTDLVYSTATA